MSSSVRTLWRRWLRHCPKRKHGPTYKCVKWAKVGQKYTPAHSGATHTHTLEDRHGWAKMMESKNWLTNQIECGGLRIGFGKYFIHTN